MPATAFGLLNGDPIEDVYCGFKLPARAIPLLHAILLKEGFRDVVSINPAYNKPPGRLSAENMERIVGSDFLLISAITRTIPQSRELAILYKKRNPGGTVITGGAHATYNAEECLEWADVVVRNEGDRTLPKLLRALEGGGGPRGVEGITYRADGGIVHEKPAAPLTEEELSRLPAPHFDEITLKQMLVWPISTSRGCPFDCDFCSVTSLYGSRYRRRSNESIISELETARSKSMRYIFFVDDNFAGRPRETKQLLRQMIERELSSERYLCQLCISAAFDAELLDLLKRAGMYAAFIGIESLSDETLRSLNKKVSVRSNKEAVDLFRKAGIWVHGMMMIGGDGDTPESLRETVLWARDNLDSVQYFAPTPITGTRFGEAMKRDCRVLTKDYYVYDGQHVVLKPKNFTAYQLQKTIMAMYGEFYSFKRFIRTAARSACSLSVEYLMRQAFLYLYVRSVLKRAFRNPQMSGYTEWLRGIG